MKKFLLLFLVVAVIAASELFLEKKSIEEDVATSLGRDRSGVKLTTYDHPAYGVRLTMPGDWHIYTDTHLVVSPFGKRYLRSGRGQAALELQELSQIPEEQAGLAAVKQSAHSWLENLRQGDQDHEIKVKKDKVVLDGHQAFRFKVAGFDLVERDPALWGLGQDEYVQGEGVFYWFRSQGKVYLLQYAYRADKKEEFEPMLKNIAHSLRFVE